MLPAWAPTFLLRSHGVALEHVGALIGPAVGIGGVTGTIAAGLIASRYAGRYGGEVHGIRLPLIALPLSAPFYALFCFAPSLTLTMAAAAVMNFLMASVVGPCIAAAIGMAPPANRAVASTLMLAASGVIGGALAPLIVGMLSDATAATLGADSLRYAMATMVVTPLLSSAILWRAYRRICGKGYGARG